MELKTGIECMAFEYHHLLVVLTNQDAEDRDTCIQAARDATVTLKRLASTPAQVYNGIVWQLIYYPFTPFFVIFSNIIDAPLAITAASDVALLSATSSYLQEMVLLGNVAVNVQKIASVFAAVAGWYVRDMARRFGCSAASADAVQSSREINQSFATEAPRDGNVLNSSDATASYCVGTSDKLAGWLATANFKEFDVPDGDRDIMQSTDFASHIMSSISDAPFSLNFDWFSWDSDQ